MWWFTEEDDERARSGWFRTEPGEAGYPYVSPAIAPEGVEEDDDDEFDFARREGATNPKKKKPRPGKPDKPPKAPKPGKPPKPDAPVPTADPAAPGGGFPAACGLTGDPSASLPEVPGGIAKQNAKATYHTYSPHYDVGTLACADKINATPELVGSLKRYPWTAYCLQGANLDQKVCGKCLRVTNRATGASVVARAVDSGGCSDADGTGLDLDPCAFNAIDTDGAGVRDGHMRVDVREVACDNSAAGKPAKTAAGKPAKAAPKKGAGPPPGVKAYTVQATYYGPDKIHGIHGGNDNIFEHIPAGQYTATQLRKIGKHFCAMTEKFLKAGYMGKIIRVQGSKATLDCVVVDLLPDRMDGKGVEIDVHDMADWLALGGDEAIGIQTVTFWPVGRASIPVPDNSPWAPQKFGFK